MVDSEDIVADKLFREIIDAIETNDSSKIVDLFSNTAKSKNDLTKPAQSFIDYVHGDVVSFTSVSQAPIRATKWSDYGKIRRRIDVPLSITTTEKIYHINFVAFIEDDYDNNNIGITELSIIDADEWADISTGTYGGAPREIQGINIASSYDLLNPRSEIKEITIEKIHSGDNFQETLEIISETVATVNNIDEFMDVFLEISTYKIWCEPRGVISGDENELVIKIVYQNGGYELINWSGQSTYTAEQGFMYYSGDEIVASNYYLKLINEYYSETK